MLAEQHADAIARPEDFMVADADGTPFSEGRDAADARRQHAWITVFLLRRQVRDTDQSEKDRHRRMP